MKSAGTKAVLVALLAALTLSGCAGGSDEGASQGADAPAKAQSLPQEGASAMLDSDGGAGRSGRRAPTAENVKVAPGARAVVYTATLKVRATNVDESAGRAKQLVLAAGGYIATESSGAGRTDLTFKIPSDRYAVTLDELTRRLGRRLSLGQQAEDVTEEVADVESRVRSAEAALVSFRKLLDRADTVGEVINVEQEIASRQAELESLQARQKSLAHRTRYATVTLELVGPVAPVVEEVADDDRGGFLGGLERGWNGLVAVVSGVLVAAGLLLPFLVPAALIAWVAGRVRRTLRSRRERRTAEVSAG
ncbi:uncharacterized protein DUF4349 [Thermomonospora umbrina]|uniref:Uncharacterized protein DUF4349 n=1 Tax=Thermomonospora umbrina TaxID=111806 RepID=A0A3D9SH89_9ACTN|nr:uncharacterized protein DUF4349 [Thermomonospora umbrina]